MCRRGGGGGRCGGCGGQVGKSEKGVNPTPSFFEGLQ